MKSDRLTARSITSHVGTSVESAVTERAVERNKNVWLASPILSTRSPRMFMYAARRSRPEALAKRGRTPPGTTQPYATSSFFELTSDQAQAPGTRLVSRVYTTDYTCSQRSVCVLYTLANAPTRDRSSHRARVMTSRGRAARRGRRRGRRRSARRGRGRRRSTSRSPPAACTRRRRRRRRARRPSTFRT